MVPYQKGPTHHAYAWQIGPFWQDTLDMCTRDMNLYIKLHRQRYRVPAMDCFLCGLLYFVEGDSSFKM